MLKQEIIINEFEQGKTIFVCDNLIAIRSCRKLVRIKLQHIKDGLEEETLATLVKNKPIGLYIVDNELTTVPFESLYDWNKSYVNLTKELYKELMDTELIFHKAEIAQEDKSKMYFSDRCDIEPLSCVWKDTLGGGFTVPNCTLSGTLGTSAADMVAIDKAEIISVSDELEKLKREYETMNMTMLNMQEQNKGGKGMDLSERINRMLDGYKRMQGENIEKRKIEEIKKAKEDDSIHEVIETIKNKAITMIDKMLKNKDISADDAKRFTHFYETELNDLADRADCKDIITEHTKETLKQIEEAAFSDYNDLESLIKEVKIRISIVETYEQAIEVLKLYDIIDENGAFIL